MAQSLISTCALAKHGSEPVARVGFHGRGGGALWFVATEASGAMGASRSEPRRIVGREEPRDVIDSSKID